MNYKVLSNFHYKYIRRQGDFTHLNGNQRKEAPITLLSKFSLYVYIKIGNLGLRNYLARKNLESTRQLGEYSAPKLGKKKKHKHFMKQNTKTYLNKELESYNDH